jgi:hypothetical protein
MPEHVEIHTDGLVVDGTKLRDLAISELSVAADPNSEAVTATLHIQIHASRITVHNDWLGERPEIPDNKLQG